MYSSVGKARQLPEDARKTELNRAVEGLRTVGEYAASSNPKLKLAVEPLNRFETDMINTVDQGLALLDMIELDNFGLLLDTFHMNIEEKNICNSIRRAKGRIANFHSCANDRGTPGEDNFDWHAIAQALKDADWTERVVIESLTKDCVEIAKAASIWRPLAESPDALASNGVRFLKTIFG
jgi:D-psicose/D-tagatose/L-ribulose 3-epimerase